MADQKPNHASSAMKCPESLADVDLFGPGAPEHWYEAYRILHRESPVLVLPGEGPIEGTDGFVLTRYADVARVVRDPDRFAPTAAIAVAALDERIKRGEVLPANAALMNASLNAIRTLRPDMDLWRSHRQELTDPWVGPGAARHTEMITRAADMLIDRFIDRGEVEFVSEFARPLPQIVLAQVLGFPTSDLARLEAWGTAQVMAYVHGRGHRLELTKAQMIEQVRQLEGFSEYVADQVAQKRRHPADDMISFLTRVTYRALGRKLSDSEINGVVYAMVLGGLETTQYAIAEQAQLLCEDPEVFRAIRDDREKVRPFSEEAMRLRSPTQGLSSRITTRDEEFQGVKVPQGSLLHIRFGAANVDPEEYEEPFEIRLDRKRIGGHLAFSQGTRSCPGSGLSRLEQNVAWNRLLDRIDHLAYAPGNDFMHQPGIMLGIHALRLEFKRAR